MDREGWSVNKKAVRRIWRQSGLKLAQPQAVPKPRRPHGQDRNACHLRPSRGKDDVWTWDFIFDRTSDGRSLKWLSLVDEYTRECLALEARRGMTAEDIRIILAEVAAGRGGPPCRLRSDNGPEFVAQVVRSWLEGTGSGPLYVAPGSPWQNGYAESFHSKVRDEFLDREEFESEPQARALGALGRGSIIRNARTVPWDTEHRPNSRRLARGMCLSKKTRPIPRLLNERTGDSHYHWTKKWGAGHRCELVFVILFLAHPALLPALGAAFDPPAGSILPALEAECQRAFTVAPGPLGRGPGPAVRRKNPRAPTAHTARPAITSDQPSQTSRRRSPRRSGLGTWCLHRSAVYTIPRIARDTCRR